MTRYPYSLRARWVLFCTLPVAAVLFLAVEIALRLHT